MTAYLIATLTILAPTLIVALVRAKPADRPTQTEVADAV